MSPSPHQTFVSVLMLLALLVQPLSATAPQLAHATSAPQPVIARETGYLFRAIVTADSPSRRARLEGLGVVLLREPDPSEPDLSGFWKPEGSTAVVLADAGQLEALARLGFQPRAADELRLLVSRQGPEKRWLAESLAPLLAQADAVAAQQTGTGIAGAAAAADAAAMIASLRAAMAALTLEQIVAVRAPP